MWSSTPSLGKWHKLSEYAQPEPYAPVAPRIVYAGVLEGDTASVFRSGEGGKTWEARN